MAARNRPRSSFARDDNADENGLWLSIVEKIRRCRDWNEEFEKTEAAIAAAKARLDDGEASEESIAALGEIEKLHREGIRAAEEELKILMEDPDELLKNLETLTSVRSAFESEPPRPQQNGKPRGPKRSRLDADGPIEVSVPTSEAATPIAASRIIGKTASRSGSVAAASTKSEDRGEVGDGESAPNPQSQNPIPEVQMLSLGPSTRAATRRMAALRSTSPQEAGCKLRARRSISPPAAPLLDPSPSESPGKGLRLIDRLHDLVPGYKDKFSVGADVFYKTKKNQEGEGILCKIINVTGEGKAKRYEIQDSDPEPEAANEPPWTVTAASLVPIPSSSNNLPALPKNKQVLAVYPQTTTFYKADMVVTRKMTCRLRFEGEDDNATEQEVERRFVLELR